jgi:hypothetical protein
MALLDFPPYTAAVEWFEEVAGVGSKITAIRSPRKFLNAFRAAFPDQTARDMRYNGVPIDLIDTQDNITVRGTTIGGHDYEWPDPEPTGTFVLLASR